jgi:glutamyl/glutaminyl-tRNA synthetase
VRLFDLAKVHRKNATFDLDKCTWLNGEYVRELGDERFCELARQALERAGIDLSKFPADYVSAALETCKGKVRIFSELPTYCGFYFKDDFEFNPEGVAKHFISENKPRLLAVRDAFAALETFAAADLETALKATAAQLEVKVGALVHPTRLAVTGSNAGPSLYHLLEVLGKEKVLARIDRALASF